jgi:hypothetical protein
MPPALSDEEYASSEDSDFAPDAQEEHVGQESGSESESDVDDSPTATKDASVATTTTSNARKRKRTSKDEESSADAGDAFENSGDEAVIQKGKKRRKRDAAEAEEDGGDGGLIKTRSQRAAEKGERKAKAVHGPVTIDVDKIWAEMAARPVVSSGPSLEKDKDGDADAEPPAQEEQAGESNAKARTSQAAGGDDSEMILIKRKYNFAGKIHTEEKLVPRSSAEAQLYLSTLVAGEAPAAADGAESSQPPRRIRRAYRSRFEPPMHMLQRADLNLLLASTISKREAKEAEDRAKKLNTVEKSRMDWAGFVDKEGLKDELELAGKSKGSFVEREDFLARSDGRREEGARRARLAANLGMKT